MVERAPIALFIFNRPDHLRRMLTSLSRCVGFDQSPIFVFADGPKTNAQLRDVEAARAVARELLLGRAEFCFADANKGLARSIIDGVDAVTRQHGRVIVVEDDLVLAPCFLTYMNAALERYANDENVLQISGHAFDAPELAMRSQAALLPFTTTWGWATWERAWRLLDATSKGWEQMRHDRALRRRFNLDGAYDYAGMLERQVRGRGDSWGIRWYWTVFRNGGLVLYPPVSLVGNEGMDGSGSHGRGRLRGYRPKPRQFPDGAIALPPPHLDQEAFAAVRRAIWRQNGGAVGKTADLAKQVLASFSGR